MKKLLNIFSLEIYYEILVDFLQFNLEIILALFFRICLTKINN